MSSHSQNSAVSLWRGVGLWYLALCLAGLAAGLWPDAILPSKAGQRPLPLPILQTLVVAQAAFFLLIYPLAILRRQQAALKPCACRSVTAGDMKEHAPENENLSPSNGISPTAVVAETLVLLVVTAPFYYLVAFLGDAVAVDVIRCVLTLLCLVPLSWALAAWLCLGRTWRVLAALAGPTLVLGLPACTYIATEVLDPQWALWLWQLAPCTFLWDTAAPRLAWLWPHPHWPAAAYLIMAAAMLLLTLLVRPSRVHVDEYRMGGPENS